MRRIPVGAVVGASAVAAALATLVIAGCGQTGVRDHHIYEPARTVSAPRMTVSTQTAPPARSTPESTSTTTTTRAATTPRQSSTAAQSPTTSPTALPKPTTYSELTSCPSVPLPGGPLVEFSHNGCRAYYAKHNVWGYLGGSLYRHPGQGYVVYQGPGLLRFVPVPGRTGMISFYLARHRYGCFTTARGARGVFFPRISSFAFGARARAICPPRS